MSGVSALTTASSATAASALVRRLPPITAASFHPTFTDGRWHKPAISAMQRAALRRVAEQLTAEQREAIPHKVNTRPSLTVRFKGHKAERLAPAKSAAAALSHTLLATLVTRVRDWKRSAQACSRTELARVCLPWCECRALKIEQAMAAMPKKVEEYYRVRPHALCSQQTASRAAAILVRCLASHPLLSARVVCARQVQRSLRRHDTQLTRILDDDEINAGKTKKSKAKPAAATSS